MEIKERLQCKHCKKDYASKQSLANHNKIKHPELAKVPMTTAERQKKWREARKAEDARFLQSEIDWGHILLCCGVKKPGNNVSSWRRHLKAHR